MFPGAHSPDGQAPPGPAPYPTIPPAPRAGRRARRYLMPIAVLAVLVLAGVGVFVYLGRATDRPATPEEVRSAATKTITALEQQPVTSARMTFFDQSGMDLRGYLTVTADGVASGAFTDAVAGRADYVAHGGKEAVRGDAAWWARRSYRQVSGVKNRWVRPDRKAFPLDPELFGPGGLAHLVRRVMVGGAPITDAESIDGRPVLGYEDDGWTVLLTRKEPHSLVWLGGRLTDDSPLHPVSLTKRDPLAVPMPPYVSISPATPEPDAEQKTRELQAKVLPQAAEPPPKQGSLAPVGPRFTQSNTARPCSTPTCSWRVTVTNTGTAAAPATIVASVTPGMPTRTFPLGVLEPGQSATTPVMSFPNPVPRAPRQDHPDHGDVHRRRLQPGTARTGRAAHAEAADPRDGSHEVTHPQAGRPGRNGKPVEGAGPDEPQARF